MAAQFNAKRAIGSGSMNRPDKSRSDSTHEHLFIEVKHATRHAVVTLWDKCKQHAMKEKKTPVVVLGIKGRPGCWFLIKDTDLQMVASRHGQMEDSIDDIA